MIRSRTIWVENGEKATNYFCNLEKHNYQNKDIPFIQKEDGSFIYEHQTRAPQGGAIYARSIQIDNNSARNV